MESTGARRASRKPRAAGAATALLLAASLAAGAFAAASLAAACLPDLAPLGPEDAGAPFDTGPGLFRGCGDGVIETKDDGGDAGESCDPGDAEAKGCLSCQITCEGKYDPASGHCYFAAGESATYNAALSRCTAENAHVVTFATQGEVDLVDSLVDGGAFWVGLSLTSAVAGFESAPRDEPGYPIPPTSGPCEGCFAVGADGGELPLDAPDASLPNCVVSRGKGSWTRTPCTGASFATVCEREPPGLRTQSCIGGFCFNVVKTSGDKTYLLGVDSLTASEARASCANLEGGRLAVFASPEEREQIAHEILGRYPDTVEQTYWIGLAEDAGAWAWEDGEPVDAAAPRRSPWGNAQPEGGAPGARAYMRLAQSYDTQLAYADDGGANNVRRYLCERPVTP